MAGGHIGMSGRRMIGQPSEKGGRFHAEGRNRPLRLKLSLNILWIAREREGRAEAGTHDTGGHLVSLS